MENMKHYYSLLLIILSLLSGCSSSEVSSTSSSFYQEPFYNEIEELHIHWNDLFNQENDKYYVYIYSVTCVPCSMLRDDAMTYAKDESTTFYFVYPGDDIPFVEDATKAESSLGATSLDDISFYNTPTLMEITNKTVTTYLRDFYQIKAIISPQGE